MADEPVLGILALYMNDRGQLEEKRVYARMIEEGHRLGLRAYVFTPDDVDEPRRRILAHLYDPSTGKWSRARVPFPDIIYDRCRIQRSPRFARLLRFREKYGHLLFLNRPLRNKWTIYKTLSEHPRFRAHLPETRLYAGARDVRAMIARHPLVYMKPANGTGGRGILRLQRVAPGSLLVQGRDFGRRILRPTRIAPTGLGSLLSRWKMSGRRFMVQQGIQLKLDNGRVHDYRMLVQKNGEGEWEVTGCAGRVGPAGSVTSNLHGGGRAAPMDALLVPWVGGEEKAKRVREEAGELGVALAAHLEDTYDSLCELALDLAIDRSGRIWLLEVNPKPSREVFARSGDRATYRKALSRPLQYALWLYEREGKKQQA